MDVIICNHIYEHVPYANQLMDEVYRVLRVNGFCYFSAGNKYMVIEGHYGLPFLSWVPKPLAHLYLRITGKGSFYYEEHLSLRGLKKLVKRFRITTILLQLFETPKSFLQLTFSIQNHFYTSVFACWHLIYILGFPLIYGY